MYEVSLVAEFISIDYLLSLCSSSFVGGVSIIKANLHSYGKKSNVFNGIFHSKYSIFPFFSMIPAFLSAVYRDVRAEISVYSPSTCLHSGNNPLFGGLRCNEGRRKPIFCLFGSVPDTLPCFRVGRWRMLWFSWGWLLAVGGWRLAVGGWPLAVGRWRLAFGGWPLAVGRWLLAVGRWLLAVGRWRLAFSLWQSRHREGHIMVLYHHVDNTFGYDNDLFGVFAVEPALNGLGGQYLFFDFLFGGICRKIHLGPHLPVYGNGVFEGVFL